MSIENILKTIDSLKDRISGYQIKSSNSERLVRYSLIDQFLRILGWDIKNPNEVEPEGPATQFILMVT